MKSNRFMIQYRFIDTERLLSILKKSKETFYRWGGGMAVFFAYTHLSHDLTTGLLTPLQILITDDLGLSLYQAGWLLSAFTITSGFSQFFGGWLGDRFSRKALMIVGLAGIGLGAVGAGLAPNYFILLTLMVVMGIVAGGYHPSATSVLSGSIDDKRRGKALAIYMLGGTIGFASCPLLGGMVGGALGWRAAYIIFGIPAIVAGTWVLLRFRQPERESVSTRVSNQSDDRIYTKGQPEPKTGLLSALKPVALIITLSVVGQLLTGATIYFLPNYLNSKFGIVKAHASMLISVIRIGGVVGSLMGGWLSDKIDKRISISIAMAATGPALYLFSVLPFGAWLMVAFVLLGFFMFMRGATVLPFIVEKVPAHLRATVLGLYFGLGMEGLSLAQPIIGRYADIYGIIDTIRWIAYVAIVLSIISVLLIWKPTLKRSTSP